MPPEDRLPDLSWLARLGYVAPNSYQCCRPLSGSPLDESVRMADRMPTFQS
jgi:hypothetical protein